MSPPYKWTPEADALLGTQDDVALGARLGVSPAVVLNRRHKLGVQALHARTRPPENGGIVDPAGRVLLDAQLMSKLRALEPILIKRFTDLGVPVRTLALWQIVEAAVDYMTEHVRRENSPPGG